MGDDPSSSYFLGGILIILYSLCKVSSTSLMSKNRSRSTDGGEKYTSRCCHREAGREAAAAGDSPVLHCQNILLQHCVGIGELEEMCDCSGSVASG